MDPSSNKTTEDELLVASPVVTRGSSVYSPRESQAPDHQETQAGQAAHPEGQSPAQLQPPAGGLHP